MKELDIILSQQKLLKNIIKIQNSVQDIEIKHKDRKDLIDSMNESIHELTDVLKVFRNLEQNLKTVSQMNDKVNERYYVLKREYNSLEAVKTSNNDTETYILSLENENIELKNKLDILIKEL